MLFSNQISTNYNTRPKDYNQQCEKIENIMNG